MNYSNIIIFDTETTGIKIKSDDMIELGYVVCEYDSGEFKVIAKESILIKIPYKIPEEVSMINHITDEMLLTSGLTATQAYQKFMQYYSPNSLLMSYNYQFDSWFLERFCQTIDADFSLTNDFICILTVVKDFIDYPTKLVNVIDKLGLGDAVVNSHRAEDDALAATFVLNKIIKIAPTIHSGFSLKQYLNVLGFNPNYPISPSDRRFNATYYAQEWNKQSVLKQTLKTE